MKRLAVSVAALVLLAACGGGGESDSAPATDTPEASTAESQGEESASTEAPVVTEAPAVTEPAPSGTPFEIVTAREDQLWSDVVDGTYADFDTMSGADVLNEAWQRLFAWPFEVPMPEDSRQSYVVVDISPYDAEWGERFALNVVSSVSVDEARALVADYQNDLFTTGVMIESNLDDGDFFTYNFEATDDAEADGWYSFSITVGPETGIDGPTGLTEIDYSLERYAPDLATLGIPFFLRGWMAEAPLDETLEFTGIYASWSDLFEGGPNTIDVDVRFEADQSRWAELLDYYGGRDWVQDGLVMESSYVPDDPSIADYVPLASFATLGVHGFDLTLERDLADSSVPMSITYGVSVGNGM